MHSILNNCTLCPRNCGVDRLNNELGYCSADEKILIAKTMLHMWEEPCISGTSGSGAIFFSNCNMKCIFCQNHVISQHSAGKTVSSKELSSLFLDLQNQGAHNINLVTPTHYVPQIIEALRLAKSNGLCIPVIYNSSGYENISTIKSLDGLVDIYLPDLKYFDNKYALKYSNASKYFNHASAAIKEMLNHAGNPIFDESGLIKKGVIIRHLMLPGLLFDSKKIIDYIYNTFGDSVYISIMNQYTPMPTVASCDKLSKPLDRRHYSALIDYALSIGVKNGFIQDEGTSSTSFIPKF